MDGADRIQWETKSPFLSTVMDVWYEENSNLATFSSSATLVLWQRRYIVWYISHHIYGPTHFRSYAPEPISPARRIEKASWARGCPWPDRSSIIIWKLTEKLLPKLRLEEYFDSTSHRRIYREVNSYDGFSLRCQLVSCQVDSTFITLSPVTKFTVVHLKHP